MPVDIYDGTITKMLLTTVTACKACGAPVKGTPLCGRCAPRKKNHIDACGTCKHLTKCKLLAMDGLSVMCEIATVTEIEAEAVLLGTRLNQESKFVQSHLVTMEA